MLEASQERQITERQGECPSPLLHSPIQLPCGLGRIENGVAVGLAPKAILIPKARIPWNSHRADVLTC